MGNPAARHTKHDPITTRIAEADTDPPPASVTGAARRFVDHSNTNPEDLAILNACADPNVAYPLPRSRDPKGRRLLLPRCDLGCIHVEHDDSEGKSRTRCALSRLWVGGNDVCAPALIMILDRHAKEGKA